MSWIANTPQEEEVINLFMNYETLGSLQPSETGIFDFFRALPRYAEQYDIKFATPSEVFASHKPVGFLSAAYPISWIDEERDTSSWMGNILQQEAFRKLYEIGERVRLCNDRRIKQDWLYLQSSDHFYYMNTKLLKDPFGRAFSPYDTPYDAFNNYMNILSDFITRVDAQYPSTIENEELNSLLTTICNQGQEIERLRNEITKLRKRSVK